MGQLFSLLLAVILAFSPTILIAQTPARQQGDDVIRTRTSEVKLDVVVKDKKGRPIKDLKASDFEVIEDGVKQKVESFRFLSTDSIPAAEPKTNANNQPAAATETAAAPPARSTPSVTALVFDRLSPEARALARKAGLAYAQQGTTVGEYTGVFTIDQALRTIQSFTENSELVRAAVEAATTSLASGYSSGASKVRENSERSRFRPANAI